MREQYDNYAVVLHKFPSGLKTSGLGRQSSDSDICIYLFGFEFGIDVAVKPNSRIFWILDSLWRKDIPIVCVRFLTWWLIVHDNRPNGSDEGDTSDRRSSCCCLEYRKSSFDSRDDLKMTMRCREVTATMVAAHLGFW